MLVHDQPPRHTLQSSTPSRTVSLASIGINTLSLSRQETLSQLPTLRRTASTESFESVATTIPDTPVLSPQSFALLQGLKIRDFAYDKDDHRFAHLAVPTKSTNSDDDEPGFSSNGQPSTSAPFSSALFSLYQSPFSIPPSSMSTQTNTSSRNISMHPDPRSSPAFSSSPSGPSKRKREPSDVIVDAMLSSQPTEIEKPLNKKPKPLRRGL